MSELWHGYLMIQNIAMQNNESAAIWKILKTYGRAENSGQPDKILHCRESLDKSKLIIVAEFDTDMLSSEPLKIMLMDTLKLQVTDIAAVSIQQPYATAPTNIITFKYAPNTENRFGLTLFGGLNATKEESWAEAYHYVYKINPDEWEPKINELELPK